MADHAASCMLALLRRLPVHTDAIRRDGWTVPFEDLLGEVNGLSLHLPATPATRHIVVAACSDGCGPAPCW